ncbi:pancreatic progenitor cell differentiation and proliferation factor-like [Alexandromys fortis]|uniref:pancreatic progenitor cell differentiation and proliferation factor-like n=1 Tax=Alexandromys fortis TaxID=100897 RepID=UPI0021520984|nr:pancreatic progenitor cell differentiation and proliferation factor-like [Microtus fortis]
MKKQREENQVHDRENVLGKEKHHPEQADFHVHVPVAAIPSSNSLVATHDYYRPPETHPGHWWASFFFGKSTFPFMTTVLESPEHPAESPQASRNPITRGLAPETLKQQPVFHPGQANTRVLS